MSLSDTRIRSAKPKEKPYKLTDGGGLYLEVTPAGGKLWRFKFRIDGKEKKLALGQYPDLSLAEARKRGISAREMVQTGDDPALGKQREKVARKLALAATFGAVAEDYIQTKLVAERKAAATIAKTRWFVELLKPQLGHRPIAAIEPYELLAVLKRLEARGLRETARRCRSFASRVFRFGVATTRCTADPAALLQGALSAPQVTHYAAIHDTVGLGKLLRAIDGYSGHISVRYTLRIAPHVFVRPGELRGAEWSEFDLDKAVWTIPANRMKARREHIVPLSSQVVAMLRELAAIAGITGLVFPSVRSARRAMSENSLNAAFRRMGYTKDEVTAHGLRSTASTLLNESGLWSADAIERALAHKDGDAVRGTYHRGQHWDERVRMAQWWSDYLIQLQGAGEIIIFARSNKTH